MQRPRIILFDVLGTLVYDPFYVEVPAFFGMELKQLLVEKHPRAWVDFELGRIDETSLLRDFFKDGRPVDGPGLKACMQSAYAWLPGMRELVLEMQSAGVDLHVLSNYPQWYALIEEKLQFQDYFERAFLSYELGLRKPDPRIYERVVLELDVAPQEALFIDDREENCAAARDVGLIALKMEGAQQLREECAALGLAL